MARGNISVDSENMFPIIKKWLYSDKDIFLRELISNASDALDKLYYRSLTDKKVKVEKEDLTIHLAFNKDERTITITDTGCGMTKEELEEKGINIRVIDIHTLKPRNSSKTIV